MKIEEGSERRITFSTTKVKKRSKIPHCKAKINKPQRKNVNEAAIKEKNSSQDKRRIFECRRGERENEECN